MTYLAILLETSRLFTLASHCMNFLRSSTALSVLDGNARLKGFGVFGPCVLDGLLANGTRFWRVVTIDAVATTAESFIGKAIAVQFETA